jgi:hypothetical protein
MASFSQAKGSGQGGEISWRSCSAGLAIILQCLGTSLMSWNSEVLLETGCCLLFELSFVCWHSQLGWWYKPIAFVKAEGTHIGVYIWAFSDYFITSFFSNIYISLLLSAQSSGNWKVPTWLIYCTIMVHEVHTGGAQTK